MHGLRVVCILGAFFDIRIRCDILDKSIVKLYTMALEYAIWSVVGDRVEYVKCIILVGIIRGYVLVIWCIAKHDIALIKAINTNNHRFINQTQPKRLWWYYVTMAYDSINWVIIFV